MIILVRDSLHIFFYRYEKVERNSTKNRESNRGYIYLELELGSFISTDIEKKENTRVHVRRRLIWGTRERAFAHF